MNTNHETGVLAYVKDLLPGGPSNTSPAALITRIRTLVNAVIGMAVWFDWVNWSAPDIAIIMVVVNALLSLFGGSYIRNNTSNATYWDPTDDPAVPAHFDPNEAFMQGEEPNE